MREPEENDDLKNIVISYMGEDIHVTENVKTNVRACGQNSCGPGPQPGSCGRGNEHSDTISCRLYLV